MVLTKARGHQGDQASCPDPTDQRGGRYVAGQPAATADEMLARSALQTAAGR